jgi:GT2 family glycosyltransferase
VADLKGCNFSVSRAAMLAIDGFDRSYEGYGREDTDVELRLQNLGLRIRSAKNLCLQFHLWHEPRAFTPANEALLDEVRRTKRVKALRGIGAPA